MSRPIFYFFFVFANMVPCMRVTLFEDYHKIGCLASVIITIYVETILFFGGKTSHFVAIGSQITTNCWWELVEARAWVAIFLIVKLACVAQLVLKLVKEAVLQFWVITAPCLQVEFKLTDGWIDHVFRAAIISCHRCCDWEAVTWSKIIIQLVEVLDLMLLDFVVLLRCHCDKFQRCIR